MTKLEVTAVDTPAWITTVTTMIMAAVEQTIQTCGSCSVMLTGGRSATRLYEAWEALPEFNQMRGVCFYFGDERCVPPDHPESNYALAMRTLFRRGVPPTCQVINMAADLSDREAIAAAYATELPDKLDLLLLSMGEDGHIASLYPHSKALLETCRRVVPVSAPKPPPARLTITPPVIAMAAQVFVLALGKQKRALYEEALRNPSDINTIPARLVLDRTWVFGE
jgi:6-phosphogluconolactonase